MSRTWRYVALAILIVAGIILLGWCRKRASMIASFEAKLGEYQTVSYPTGSGSVAAGEIPYRSGKVFIMRPGFTGGLGPNPTPPRVHSAWLSLPSAMRAASPEEVDTLIVASVVPAGDHELPQKSEFVSKDPRSGIEIRKQKIVTEWWPAAVGVQVYDLRNRLLIGCYTVKIEDEENRDLVRFVRSMPTR